MVAARKHVPDYQDRTLDLTQKMKEFDKSLEKFNEIPLSLPANYGDSYLDEKTIDLDVDKVVDEMDGLADNADEENDLSLSLINETGSCAAGPENESASGWYDLIPQDDSIYQVLLPTTFSELDESLNSQVEKKTNIFISQSKTPSRYKPNSPQMKHSVKKHSRRVSLASFIPLVKNKSPDSEKANINGNEIVRAWLDSEFDKKPSTKNPRVGRGMLAADDGNEVFKKPEAGFFRRKIHPKYATISESRPVTTEQKTVDDDLISEDGDEGAEPVKAEREENRSSGRKRKREEEVDDAVNVLPSKRSRTGRWDWVGRWLPKWVSGLFGFSE